MARNPFPVSSGAFTVNSGAFQTSTGPVDTSTVDTFEDGGLGEYSGYTSYFTADTSNPYEGSYSLTSTDDEFLTGIYSMPGDGLNHYPEKGDIIHFHTMATDTSSSTQRVWWGAADRNNHYNARLDFNNGNFDLRVEVDGSYTTVAQDTNVSYTDNTWYRVETVWDDGTLGGSDNDITLRLIDMSGSSPSLVSEVTGNDNTFATERGVGFQSGAMPTGSSQNFDDVYIADSTTDLAEVLEDFEGSSPLSNFAGSTGSFEVTTDSPLEGSQSLRNTGSFGEIARTGTAGETTRGNTYTFKFQMNVTGENTYFIFGGQSADGAIDDNSYQVWFLESSDSFELQVEDGGNRSTLASATVTYTTGEIYTVEIDYAETGNAHEVRLNDSSGSNVATVNAVDDTHTGGNWGMYGGSTSTTGAWYWDYVTEGAASSGGDGGSGTSTIDSWDDGNASEYTQTVNSDTWTFGSSATDQLDGSGSAGLENGSGYNIFVSTSGLNYYPQDGDIISGYLREDSSWSQPFYGWHAGNESGSGDLYAVMISRSSNGSNELEIRRFDDGSSTLLGSDTTTAIGDAEWVDVETAIDAGTYTADVYEVDQSTGDRLNPSSPIASVSVSDSTYTSNTGFAFGNRDASGGPCLIDGVRKVGSI